MIRINLLPSDERKKKRTVSLPSISGGAVMWLSAVFVVYVGALFGVWALQARTIKDYDAKITEAKEESARLAPQLAKIRKLTAEREEVNRRLSVIASLDRDRYLRVKMLNELSLDLPANCWITELTEQGGTRITIDGVTFSNFIVADLMTNMESSEEFSDVALIIAEEGNIDETKVLKFTLNSKLNN
jgi:type IV pilus assembly protein PilN